MRRAMEQTKGSPAGLQDREFAQVCQSYVLLFLYLKE